MIKLELNVCAKISYGAIVKTASDGSEFITFSVKLPVTDNKGKTADMIISVSADGDKSKASVYAVDRRVKISGTMNVIKKNGKVYYNLRADKITLANSNDTDLITGNMEFLGKVGKRGVDVKPDKKGNDYKVFSAFSTDKNDGNAEFTWVRFLYFYPKEDETFLAASSYIRAVGEFQLGIFKDDISLECRVKDVSPWVLEKKKS